MAQYVSANLSSPRLGLALQLRADFFGPGTTARANLTFTDLPGTPGGAKLLCVILFGRSLSFARRRGMCVLALLCMHLWRGMLQAVTWQAGAAASS